MKRSVSKQEKSWQQRINPPREPAWQIEERAFLKRVNKTEKELLDMVHQCKTKKEFLSNLDQWETDAWMERIASDGWEEDKKDTLNWSLKWRH